jgi:NAD(P)-dependent dehydrogenase (short-subunit alcohol dehydrogenase family)
MVNSVNPERFIVNVTSSEGQFSYSNKTIHHPHTNMTKAALNMLTRTSAAELVEDHIYMNAVDVGWVSTGACEAKRKALFENNQVPPLDSVDGAMRIFKSIVDVLQGDKTVYGKLLKDYKVVDW